MAPSTVSFPTVSVRFRKPTLNTGVVLGGEVWCGVVWCGVGWCGVVWCGVVWGGVGWGGVVRCGGVSLRCWEEAASIHIQSP